MKTTIAIASLLVASFLTAQTDNAPVVFGGASLVGGEGQTAEAKLRFINVVREGKEAVAGELEFAWAKRADKLAVGIVVSPANRNLIRGTLRFSDHVATLNAPGRMRVVSDGKTTIFEGKVQLVVTDMGKETADGFAIKFTPNRGDRTFKYEGKTKRGGFTVKTSGKAP